MTKHEVIEWSHESILRDIEMASSYGGYLKLLSRAPLVILRSPYMVFQDYRLVQLLQ
jgi:hypothetical protein